MSAAQDVEAAAGSTPTTDGEVESGQARDPNDSEKAIVPEKDPYTVDWNGPDDPGNPRNWKKSFRILQIILISYFTLNMNLAATMFSPGVPQLVEEFHVTNSYIETMSLTIYVLGFATGIIIAPLSELYGRLPLYHLSNTVWLGFTLGCAFSTNIAMFLVFRFLAGCAGSVPMTCGGGTIADLIPPEHRGKFMGIWGLGPLIGPVIGPIIGGFMSQSIGWRWTFRLLAMLGGVGLILGVVILRETSEAILLKHKAARLRKETGNDAYQVAARVNKVGNMTPGQMLVRALLRPSKMLLFSPIVLLLSLYCGFVFGLIFFLFDSFPQLFGGTYGFSPGLSGLAYLGLGIGMLSSLILFTVLSDKQMKQTDGVSRPEIRLKLMMWFSPVISAGFFWYGWSAEARTHWIVPILGTLFIGFGSFFVILVTQVYLVDVFDAKAAASALSAALVMRNLFGTFLPFSATPLYDSLGLGWGNSLLGFVCVAFAPVPFLFFRYGEALRKRFPVDL
ncbi:major facilitator superfamily domain-containing protein [Pseudomassariella vexata]|uniref:Major facilitator superfamily domain-containing protein n=1 Tax=Pseudomassariella vexata TaxID=1141098 RepID=A0A1Y2EE12_9PEZI|nr:major facilitator superfamily domain-containing protein [Pseudomassariella vexata]ORY69647.1 major facilitator superfamily domain-containing protein [Pseudomassariella vexata]